MAHDSQALQHLVRDRRADLGLSIRDLADRSIDPQTGEHAKQAWISKLERGEPTEAPKPWVLRGLAAGLRLPEDTVKEAAARQYFELEVTASSDETVRLITARAETLSTEDRARLAEIAEVFARSAGR
ncbi:helix-turn-helix domain-containing protein [Streptomyces chilikensis]|uniref:Helix-turn-helix domain-containing protein n=1 Tax=Streptomyces chilikensis TaxID=1194079 RepID=A0ABV3EJ92_9ACTN